MEKVLRKYGFRAIKKTLYMQSYHDSKHVVKLRFHARDVVDNYSHVKVFVVHVDNGPVDYEEFNYRNYNVKDINQLSVELMDAVTKYVEMFAHDD